MTVGTPSEIAATEARIKELQELWVETHSTNSAIDLLAASLLSNDPAANRETSRRVQLGGAIQAELKDLNARLTELQRWAPRETLRNIFCLAIATTVMVGIGSAVDRLGDSNKHATANMMGIFFGGITLVAAAGAASSTRWQGREGLGMEAGK